MSGYPPEKRPKVDPALAAKVEDVIGWHFIYWHGGQIKICLRPGGQLYSEDPDYRVAGSWVIVDGEVIIDWKEHGKYSLSIDEAGKKHMKGYVFPRNEGDETNWRKTLYNGALSPLEKLLFGNGAGTEWEFKHADGNFLVEFRCDGNNSFVHPCGGGDAKWAIGKSGKTITISWGKYGEYELDIDVKGKSMEGYPKWLNDPQDKDERTLDFKRNLEDADIQKEHGHGEDGHGDGHGHGHGHREYVGKDDGDGNAASDGHGHEHGHGHGHGHGAGHGHAGGITGIGNFTIAGEKFMVDREGQIVKGTETTFGVERVGAGTATGFKAWMQDAEGSKVCDPVEGEGHGDHFHFTVTPKSDAATLAFQYNDQVSTINVQPGAFPTQGGIQSVLEDADGKTVGFIELKLHDDAGDLELWICKDGAMTEPLDFPANTTITVTCPTYDNKSAQLTVRNEDQNEDEEGNANMRDGKTNYFIFPGESDQDPEWLVGEKFRSTTTVTFTAEGKTYTAPPFVLVPHM